MARTVTYTPQLQWTGNTGTGTSSYNDYARDYVVRIEGKPDLAGSASHLFRGKVSLGRPDDIARHGYRVAPPR